MSKKLVKSTSIVSSMTFLSRISGFVRDMFFAQMLGAAGGFDAFLVAFKIPNFMRRLFAEGAFAQAFVPVLSEFKETQSEDDVRVFVAHMMASLLAVVTLFVVVAMIAAPLVVLLFAPGFYNDPQRYDLTVHLLRITFPYLICISLVSFSGSLLNVHGRFSVPAFTPVLMNVALLCAIFFAGHYYNHSIVVIAWGVFAAGIAQLLFQLPFLYRLRLLVMPRWGWRDPGVQKVFKLILPAILGVSVAQVSVLIDTLFASFLPHGSISWLYYSDRLTYFPLGVIGIALATVVLPHLSKKHAQKSKDEYMQAFNWGLKMVLLFGIPAAIGLFMLAGPLLITLFQHGKFDYYDMIMTRKSLLAYSLGLPSFMLIKLLATGFYSRQDIKTPVKIAIVALTINIMFNFILITPLAHAGLALSTTIATSVNAIVLFVVLYRKGQLVLQAGWGKFMLQLVIANVLMGLGLLFLTPGIAQWIVWSWFVRVGALLMLVIGAGCFYALSLLILGLRGRDLMFDVAKDGH